MSSRVFSLCARDTNITLDEVESVGLALKEQYEVVFLDDGLYEENIEEISKRFPNSTKVLLSKTDTNSYGMDILVKKPFLPSQIIEILNASPQLESVKQGELHHLQDVTLPTDVPVQVLDQKEVDKIKSLLEMDDVEGAEVAVPLEDEAYTSRKVEMITEQLRAEGLEIVEQEEMVNLLAMKEEEEVMEKEMIDVEVSEQNSVVDEEEQIIHEIILEAIQALTPKKRKKLLKGKEIQLTLKYKRKK